MASITGGSTSFLHLGGLISVVVIFLPAKITGNTMLMGIVGLGNYALCIVACIVFFGAFALLALAILPLGARDLLRLFRHLREGGEKNGEGG